MLREVAEQSKETDRRIQENDRLIKEQREETDKCFKETDKRFKETDKRIKKLNDLFTSQWGRLMESLVEGDLVPLLTAYGIEVADTTTRLKGQRKDGGSYEFDIIAHNGNEVVFIEVKTTLRPDDVKAFLHKLNHIEQWVPRYSHNTIYGAMAWLQADTGAEKMVEKRGLLSIRATGSSAALVNRKGFKAKAW
ncbi:hypothetical protein D5085_16560 [Ectothiorhodospiraceae bacterium BW-2]|nr:hypothetical protein D5085_16560 [Ectothiorhodospiraceae bacterium BW-2]